MTKRTELTKKQKLVYDSIVDYQVQHGYAPSIRELCVICNLASTSSVYSHLKKLESRRWNEIDKILKEPFEAISKEEKNILTNICGI